MKRLKVSFDEPIHRRLEASAIATGTSMPDEVRVRVLQTLEADSIPEDIRQLVRSIDLLAELTQRQTGWAWREHPLAHDVLRHAINSLLDRVQPPETPSGTPPRQPVQIVPSKDPRVIGSGLEVHALSLSEAQFRPDASIRDAGPIRRRLKIEEQDQRSMRARWRKA